MKKEKTGTLKVMITCWRKIRSSFTVEEKMDWWSVIRL